MPAAFDRAFSPERPGIGTVTAIHAMTLACVHGSARFTAWPARPLTIDDLAVGDTVAVSWHNNVAYATAVLARNLANAAAAVTTSVVRYVDETIALTPLTAHALFGDHHTGELAQQQAPWALPKYG